MHKRINITLPVETIQLLDRVMTGGGNRSSFINDALQAYLRSRSKAALRSALKSGYQRRAAEARQIAVEWFPLEEEAAKRGRR